MTAASRMGLVLIIEDDRAIAEVQRMYFTRAGYTVHTESDGSAGLAQVRLLRPAIVILDVGLPGLDGVSVCRAMRDGGDATPVIFVTARDDEVDRILGLELGADDYVTKPFSPRELVARVSSVLRRASGDTARQTLSAKGLRMELGTRRVQVDDEDVVLTAMEFDLLAALMRRPGMVLSREQLLSTVWGMADYSGSRTVDVHVAQLRSKLGDGTAIRTHRGVGYSVLPA